MKAVIKKELGQVELVTDRPVPQLREGYLLIRTKVVAINPIDWMKADGFPAPNTLLGHDYAGIVEEVGPGVTRAFTKGDRVFGYTLAGDHRNPDNGAFAQYIVAKANLQYKIPEGVPFEKAAALGAAIMTANMALFLKLGLIEERERARPRSKNEFVFVYGGSTSSGAMAIQLAARSGYTVISTCSPHNFDSVKALGASHVFDYKEADCAQAIRQLTANQLRLVLDTVAVPQSAKLCAEAMSTEGERYVQLLPVPFPRADVEAIFMDATTTLGEYYEYGMERTPVPVDADAFAFGKAHVQTVELLLQHGDIGGHETEIGDGGLEGVLDGIKRMREGRVSGRKLVYLVE